MGNYDKFDDLFRSKLENFKVKPPETVWANVKAEIPKPKPFYEKWSFAGGVIGTFVLLLMSSAYFFWNYSIQINPRLAEPMQQKDYLGKTSNYAKASLSDILKNNASSTNIITHTPKNPSINDANSIENANLLVNAHTSAEHFQTTPQLNTLDAPKSTSNTNLRQTTLAILNFLQELNTYRINRFNLFSDNELSSLDVSSLQQNMTFDKESNDAIPLDNASNTTESTPSPHSQALSSTTKLFLNKLENISTEQLQLDFQRPIGISTSPRISLPQMSKENRWFAGSFFQYQGTLSLSKQTASEDEVAYQQKPYFGNSYGVALGYNFSPKFGIQTEWSLNTSHGDRKEYTSTENITQNILVKNNYFNIPIMLRYRHRLNNKTKRNPIVMNHLVGFQYGYLKSSDIFVDNVVFPSDELLNRSQLGFVLGLDYDFFFNQNTSFTFGARSTFSRGINSLDQFVNSPSSSVNVLLGINASLRYSFGSNKK